jgi:alanine racemase
VLAETLIQEGCRDFFVARPLEAYDLRKVLDGQMPDMASKVSVIVLDGLPSDLDPQLFVDNHITPVLNTAEQVKRWNAKGAELGCKLAAILQVDSGMSRAGLSPEQLDAVLDNDGRLLAHIDLKYVMSHLANAGSVEAGASFADHANFVPGADSEKQRLSFEDQYARVQAVAPGAKACLGASSTVFLGADYHKDMIRLGGTFHGQAPISTEGNPYAPVLGLTTKISELRTIPAGTGVGYGLSYKPERDTKVATLSIGYADGLPRHPGGPEVRENGPHVLIGGHKAPVIGKTSMDMLAVDVTDLPDELLGEGASVTLIGGPITTDHHGDMYGTNASETQVKLSDRVHVKYTDDLSHPLPDPDVQSSIQEAWRALPSRV